MAGTKIEIYFANIVKCFPSPVLEGGLSLGHFLATIKIYSEIGEEFKAGFDSFMKIVQRPWWKTYHADTQ